MTFSEVYVKRSVILTDRTSRYFASVKNEKTSFASWARTFESAGFLFSFERASN